MPAPDRRTIGELLADSDALARETLLDATPEIAPAMVRSWNQLVTSAAHLWAALSSPPDDMSKSDPTERLRLVGEAIARSVRAGHWPGHGPTDDHMTEGPIASQTLRKMIETDADVVAGDSGGPLYDGEGEVVGIDTAASTGSEIDGYAIPIARAMTIVEEIRAGKETKTVQIGPAAFLGIEMASDSVASTSLGGDQTDAAYGSGAVVGGVVDGLPAARAGLTEGDTIARIGSHTISSASDVSTLLASYNPGDRIKIGWVDPSGTSTPRQ